MWSRASLRLSSFLFIPVLFCSSEECSPGENILLRRIPTLSPPARLPVLLPQSLRCQFLSVYFFISVIALFITVFLFFLLGPCETFLICSPKPLHAICEILVNSVACLRMLFQVESYLFSLHGFGLVGFDHALSS